MSDLLSTLSLTHTEYTDSCFFPCCLGWFIGPLSFSLGLIGVLLVLGRREFTSDTVGCLRNLA